MFEKGVAPGPEQILADALGINESYWNYIFNNLMKSGYVTGVIVKQLLGSNEIQVKIQYNKLQITPVGIVEQCTIFGGSFSLFNGVFVLSYSGNI